MKPTLRRGRETELALLRSTSVIGVPPGRFGAVLAFAVGLFMSAPPDAARASEPSADQSAAVATAASKQVLDRLDAAWDAMDGARFAAEFTEDTDVINVNGSRFIGRADLARQMQFLFDGRLRGSRHAARSVDLVRELAPDLTLVVSSASVAVPSGPLAPELRSRQSFLLQRSGDRWLIRHWHNTPIQTIPEGAPTR